VEGKGQLYGRPHIQQNIFSRPTLHNNFFMTTTYLFAHTSPVSMDMPPRWPTTLPVPFRTFIKSPTVILHLQTPYGLLWTFPPSNQRFGKDMFIPPYDWHEPWLLTVFVELIGRRTSWPVLSLHWQKSWENHEKKTENFPQFSQNENILSKLANYSPILTKIFSFWQNWGKLSFSSNFPMIFVIVWTIVVKILWYISI